MSSIRLEQVRTGTTDSVLVVTNGRFAAGVCEQSDALTLVDGDSLLELIVTIDMEPDSGADTTNESPLAGS